MNEKREIQYREIGRTATHVVIEITKQTHRGEAFAKDGNCFRNLCSEQAPDCLYCSETIYLRGSDESKDRLPICIPLDRFDQFAADVAKYNRTEGGFKTANWRAEKGKSYWFVTGRIEDQSETETGCMLDCKRHESGNYFRTKEQSAEAARRLKECLKQYHTEIGE